MQIYKTNGPGKALSICFFMLGIISLPIVLLLSESLELNDTIGLFVIIAAIQILWLIYYLKSIKEISYLNGTYSVETISGKMLEVENIEIYKSFLNAYLLLKINGSTYFINSHKHSEVAGIINNNAKNA